MHIIAHRTVETFMDERIEIRIDEATCYIQFATKDANLHWCEDNVVRFSSGRFTPEFEKNVSLLKHIVRHQTESEHLVECLQRRGFKITRTDFNYSVAE